MIHENLNFNPARQDLKLSEHFELNEFTASQTAVKHGIDNTPPTEAVENLRALCVHTLEPLREALGLPIIITSGYRTKELNNLLVHSSNRSQHMEGCAADFYVAQGPVSRSKVQVSGVKFQVPGSKSQVSGFKSWISGVKSLVSSVKSLVSGNHLVIDSVALHCKELETGGSPMKLETSSRRELLIKAFKTIILDDNIDFDQLIIYPTFIHVSYVRTGRTNRRKLIKAFGNGKYHGLSRAEALELV